MRKLLLIIFIVLCLTSASIAKPEVPQIELGSVCKLFYAYDQRDGIITCEVGRSIFSFFPHPSARISRKLPRNFRIVVVYEETSEGQKLWKRIYFWK